MATQLRVDMQELGRVYRATSPIVSVVAVPERRLIKNQHPCDCTLQRVDKLAVVRLHSGMAACRPVHVYT
jgi:hypothetical protein